MIKRLFDILFSLLGLILLSPIFLIVTLKVRKNLGTPVFFKQVRPGKDGKPFTMIKFRSMRDAYDKNGNPLPNKDRLTPFGKKLRSTSLDELPELWNVLKGDMSLVGPRPLLMEYLPLYNTRQATRHNVRPGITGWAQVNGRNAISWEEKFEFDAWYVENRSFWLDIKIILLTIKTVFSRKGISNSTDITMPKFTGTKNPQKQLIIIGASGFGKEVAWLAKRLNYKIIGFLDDNYTSNKLFYGYPILGKITDHIKYVDSASFVIAIANPHIRKTTSILLTNTSPSIKFAILIDPSTQIDLNSTEIGIGTVICAGSIITADVKIGSFSIINKLCSIGHDVTLDNFITLAPMVMLGGNVRIKQLTEIGASTSVKQGLTINQSVIVGMASNVIQDIPANTLAIGNPAHKSYKKI